MYQKSKPISKYKSNLRHQCPSTKNLACSVDIQVLRLLED
uniref:Uncharacterized protein n=1 Tax=Arundo donax TaxID=35708 RepID=A0A0A9HS29_ARUDO